MNSFRTVFSIPYYEINIHREAGPVAVLNYLEEAAIRHSEKVGCGIDRLLERGQGWMLTRWSLFMTRYPRWNQTIDIETWPSKFERFYATREFRITGEDGKVLGVATSQWIFYDLRRKKPVRIPVEIMESYGSAPLRMVEDSFSELPFAGYTHSQQAFDVRLSDIDAYGHANNTRYVEWMMETVPLLTHQLFYPAVLEVCYKKEVTFGAAVISEITELEINPGEKRFLHRILNNQDGTELVRARSLWIRRHQ